MQEMTVWWRRSSHLTKRLLETSSIATDMFCHNFSLNAKPVVLGDKPQLY